MSRLLSPVATGRSRPGWLLVLLVAVLLTAGFGWRGRLWAYTTEGIRWPSNGNIVMYLQLGSSGTLIDGTTSWGQSAEDALAIWNGNLGSGVKFTVVRDATIPLVHGDGNNSVFFGSKAFDTAFGPDVLALTLSISNGGVTKESDVVFNTAKSFNSYRGPLRTAAAGGTLIDFHRVALHEFGHVLGLDHPDEHGQTVAAIMNSRTSNTDVLQTDDIAGVRAIYGGGAAPTPTPNPTPTPTPTHPAFFSGEASVGNGVYYLTLPNGTPFGYYSYLSDPRYFFHFDLGYEFVFDAKDGRGGVYLYDFASNGFFYTSPGFPFPYLYDFKLNAVLYYYGDTKRAGHYTTNPRYFFNTATGKIISK